MNKELEELFKGIFVDGNHTKRSVNADKQLEEQDIEEVYSIIDKSYDEACKTMRKLIKSRKTVAVPLLYRKVAFLLACTLCYEGEKVGAQKKVLDDLELAHNSFTKWGMEPARYFEEKDFDVEKAPSLTLTRFGKKNDDLCREFVKISSQVSYSTFVDVFTGLGTITATKPKRGIEYINDYDNTIFNFLLVLRDYPDQFIEVAQRVINDLNSNNKVGKVEYFKKVYDKFEEQLEYANYSHDLKSKARDTIYKFEAVDEWGDEGFTKREKIAYSLGVYDYLKGQLASDPVENLKLICEKIIDDIKSEKDNKKILGSIEYYKSFINEVKKYVDSDGIEIIYADGIYEKTFKKKIKEKKVNCQVIQQYDSNRFDEEAKKSFESNIELAVAFYFYHCFDINGKPSKSGIEQENLKVPAEGLENILDYSKRLKKVKILHQDFRDIIRNFNQEGTLLYLDSPYISTEGYEVGFNDVDHIDMINLLKQFKGRWIFSCRSSVRNEEFKISKGKKEAVKLCEESIRRIASHLSLFRNRGYFVLPINTQGNVELIITNFEFMHKDIVEFDEYFNNWTFEKAE